MAEIEGQRHDKECAESTGAVCICECRGKMHGMRASRTAKLRRMGEVHVTAKSESKPTGTAAQRARNPVTLTTSSGAKVTSVHVDEHGVVTGSKAAELRDAQGARVKAATRDAMATVGADATPPAEKKPFTGPVQDLSPGAPAGATIDRAAAAEIMHGPVVMWMDKNTGRPVMGMPSQVAIVRGDVVRDQRREDIENARRHGVKVDDWIAGGRGKQVTPVTTAAARDGGPTPVVKAAATPNSVVADVATVKPPANATPGGPAIGANEPLWMDKHGNPVKHPSQVAIVRGDVVRDRRREDIRAAENATSGQAVETDLFGTSTIMGGAQNFNDKPKPKTSGPVAQQLGMFADESKQLPGQTALTSAISPDLATPVPAPAPPAPAPSPSVLAPAVTPPANATPARPARQARLDDPQYRKDYERGWKASQRNTPGALEKADMANTPRAWYHGWEDFSNGGSSRKWDTPKEYDEADRAAAAGEQTFRVSTYRRTPAGNDELIRVETANGRTILRKRLDEAGVDQGAGDTGEHASKFGTVTRWEPEGVPAAQVSAAEPHDGADAYDRPAHPQQQAAQPNLDAPAVPDDLTDPSITDDQLSEMIGKTGDGPTVDRIVAELDRRQAAEEYQQLVDAVPDAEGLKALSEEQVVDHMLKLTSVNHAVDEPTVARIEADLERREAEERAQLEEEEQQRLKAHQTLRTYIDEVVRDQSSTDDDLEAAARYANELGDGDRYVAVFQEWDRREQAAQAKLDEQHAAAAKAEAERLAAAQEAARQEAARVAKVQADREALDREFQAMYPSQLSSEFVQNAASMDPVKQARHDAAKREMDRRAADKAAEDKRREIVARHDRIIRGPVNRLTDAELADGIANHEADGYNTNSIRMARLADLREEKARRDAENARVDALKANVPTAPARLRNPIGALGDLKRSAEHDQRVRDRLVRARMSALGVPEPEVTGANEWSVHKARDKARKQALDAAAKADPRSAQEQAATVVAHYRHLALIDNPTIRDDHLGDYERRAQFGPPDETNAPPLTPAAPFEKIPKAFEAFQDIRRQAMQDRAAGDNATASRVEKAYRRGLGLPDDATDDEVRSAYASDERSSGDMASQMIVEFRALAKSEGVDPDDRLRYGPKEKTPRAPGSPGYRVKPTPAQEAEVDRRVAAGEDYIDAYAGVYGLDPDAMRREQGPKLNAAEMKAAYEEHTHLQYLDAEKATAGHLLNAKGKAKGVDPIMLFSGSINQARPYASEELLRYWAQNERLTFADFKANMRGDTAAIRARATRSNGRDFV